MTNFEYFLSELVYEAARYSKKPEINTVINQKHIAELQFLLAKEDLRRLKIEEKYFIN